MCFLSVGRSCTPLLIHFRVAIKMALNQAQEIAGGLPLLSFFFVTYCAYYHFFCPGTIFFAFGSIILTLFGLFLLVVQPFKSNVHHYSSINAMFLLFLALFYAAIIGRSKSLSDTLIEVKSFFFIIILFLACLPLIYISILILRWIISQRKFGLEVLQRWRARRQGYMAT